MVVNSILWLKKVLGWVSERLCGWILFRSTCGVFGWMKDWLNDWLGCSATIDFLACWLIQFYQFISRFYFHSSSWISRRFTLSNYLSISHSHSLLHHFFYIIHYIYIHHLESFHFQINNSNQLQHQYHQYHHFINIIIIIINTKRLLIQFGINWNNEWKKRRRIKSKVSQ